MEIGEKIKALRKQHGLTQAELGLKCNPTIAESTIRRYELGKLNPKIETISKIATALGVPLQNLLSGTSLSYDLDEGYSDMLDITLDSIDDLLKPFKLNTFGEFLRAYDINFEASRKHDELGKTFQIEKNKYFLTNSQAKQLPEIIIKDIKRYIKSCDGLNKIDNIE